MNGAAEAARIADELDRAFRGDPWHGSPLSRILAGITAGDAAARPLRTAHSIWEIVLHVTAWTHEVERRLRGHPPGQPPAGDWPPVVTCTDEAWASARRDVDSALDELLHTLATFPDDALWNPVGQTRDQAAGTGMTFYVMLHGLVQHTVYHSAQIAALRRVLAGGVP